MVCIAYLLIWGTRAPSSIQTAGVSEVSTFWINYAKTPDPRLVLAHDLVIVHPSATIPMEEAHRAKVQVLAYVSVVEIAPDAPYRQRVSEAAVPLMGKNPEWNSDLADVRSAAWRHLVVEELAAPAAKQGFDGFFLDTAESVELLAAKIPAETAAFREGLLQLVRDLRVRFPERKIIINRGFRLQPEVFRLVDGLLVESLFRSYDFAKKAYRAVPENDTAWLLDKLKPAQAAGVPVYVVDFVPPQDLKLADATVARIRQLGFCPLIADPAFEQPPIAPVRPHPNRVLVLYGKRGNLDEQGHAFYPADTWTALFIHMPLEWMGYQLEYYNAASQPPPTQVGPEYVAIMVDPWVQIAWTAQKRYADWIAQEVRRGRKVLLMGSIPFEEPEARDRLWNALGIQARWRLPAPFCRVETLRQVDPDIMSGDEKARPVSFQYEGLQPPANAKIHLSVTAVPQGGKPLENVLVCTAPWGGLALDPGVCFRRPDNVERWYLDPFRFLARALDRTDTPVPDPATLTGHRILFSHIDADGFSNFSQVERGKRSAEVICDHILTQYPLPITSSIIEAEVRGHIQGQKKSDSGQLLAIAKRIFALPNIEAASHTYSHPFFWIANDHTAGNYDAPSLDLAPAYRLKTIDVKRETEGSIRFINENLVPAGKRVELMLWSGNCRPGPEALRIVRNLNVENLNGGDTVISPFWPSLTMVSPRTMPWDGERQIQAGIQNEMLFTQNFQGPLFGGYAKVIQTFERTGHPRRLKPVDIYYHMCSGDRRESLQALKTVYDWVMARPLRAVSAAAYARLVRGAEEARVYRVSSGEWILVGDEHLQTFRMEAGPKVPDMRTSRGLIGYCVEDGYLYLSTDGRGRTHLVLTSQPPPHMYLSKSSADIRFQELGEKRAAFSVRDFRPVKVQLGGLPPSAKAEVKVDGRRSIQTASPAGILALQLPPVARVEIKAR